MSTEPKRITWTETPYAGARGKIGKVSVATISWSTTKGRQYRLRMGLPGFEDADGMTLDEAKARAERRVEAFVKHLGAQFPDKPEAG